MKIDSIVIGLQSRNNSSTSLQQFLPTKTQALNSSFLQIRLGKRSFKIQWVTAVLNVSVR